MGRKETMTILEQLREKKKNLTMDSKGFNLLCDLLTQYDLALENALLKLKNRAVEIKDLKHRLEKSTVEFDTY